MAVDLKVAEKARTLVLCFDGTSNEYDADNTNVVKFFALLRKDCFDEQLCYYQAGVGTYFEPGVVSPLFEWWAKILDLAFAWYLDVHVMDGYKFLMQNYRSGDKICIFGFSRGAYTARALGGLLYKVGLLPRDNEAQVPFAYRMYKRTDAAGLQLCAGFKQTYCQTVNIEFMGVWYTVASVGVISGRTLPFTNSNSSIKTFRHALSLDEHRAKFQPNFYHRTAPNAKAARLDPEHASACEVTSKPASAASSASLSEAGSQERKKKKRWSFFGRRGSVTVKKTGKSIAPVLVEDDGEPDDVLEVWFSGCHSDVGGGSVSNDTTSSLANIPLRWMIREVVASGCGILFDSSALMRANITLSPEPTSAEIDMDMTDAVQPLYDELKLDPLWWLLEIIPLQFTWQDADGVWHREWSIHLGRGRKVIDPHPNFHASVQKRMSSPLNYTPKAKWAAGTEVYVE
ncbi:hypothetical protein HYPSUDRAFT_138053 [Hypholoma sublateritium FD-334 SS-4]|uniref:T6SS Phospholipase effector Tle1-like catalytic domain-containing protein n=1 Tax=Hypholoma sublateritium (strain FD-334 SS-4) TaxID=945553 RepID=A0A0D2PUG2_HYPSF|nr:hypothetical protein HYPSUDRAFT_138053 [Hypholoma sublateritium FD-334 SS-4]